MFGKEKYIKNLELFIKENLRKETLISPNGMIAPNSQNWLMYCMNSAELGAMINFSNIMLGRKTTDNICDKFKIENKY